MSEGELRPWLTLRAKPGFDDATLCRLLRQFGSPEAIFGATARSLTERGGLNRLHAEALLRPLSVERQRQVDRELEALARASVRIVTCLDPSYPRRLNAVPDPPLLLYVTGSLTSQDEPCVAVVGTRRPTAPGQTLTEQLAQALVERGFTVVSGLARGIDGAAHRGALAGQGRTIAVLGCGIDQTYPPEHRRLRREIEERGAVLSDLPWGAAPHAHHFPRRNRLISGLSLGVVVTEAAARSGALITARLAADQGREVFAVPGPVQVEQSRGPNGLIKQGAKLVEGVEDIVEELVPQLDHAMREQLRHGPSSRALHGPCLNEEESVVYKLLSHEPVSIDDLILRSGLSAATVAGALLAVELKGLARRLPGHRAIRVSCIIEN